MAGRLFPSFRLSDLLPFSFRSARIRRRVMSPNLPAVPALELRQLLSGTTTISLYGGIGVQQTSIDLPSGSQGFVGLAVSPVAGSAYVNPGNSNQVIYENYATAGSDLFTISYLDSTGNADSLTVNVTVYGGPESGGSGTGTGSGTGQTSGTGSTSSSGSGGGEGMGMGMGSGSGSGTPPDAINDEADRYHGRTASGSVLGGIDGQMDFYSNGAQFTLESQASNGIVTINPDTGDWTWVPDLSYEFVLPGERPRGDFVGTDTFVYRLTDDNGSDTATVTISFTNSAPNAGVAEGFLMAKDTIGGKWHISQYANGGSIAIDNEGDDLAFGSDNPDVLMQPDGFFWYTPPLGTTGLQTLSYKVNDTLGDTSTGVLKINILKPTVSIQATKDFRESAVLNPIDERDTGIFTLTRQDDGMLSALSVQLEYTGALGRFTGPSGVTFPVGVSSVQVKLKSKNDGTVQPSESEEVTARIVPNDSAYMIGTGEDHIALSDNDGWRWKMPDNLTASNQTPKNIPVAFSSIPDDVLASATGTIEGDYGSWTGFWSGVYNYRKFLSFGGWESSSIWGSASVQATFDRQGNITIVKQSGPAGESGLGLSGTREFTADVVGQTVNIHLSCLITADPTSVIDTISLGILGINITPTPVTTSASIDQQLILEQYENDYQ